MSTKMDWIRVRAWAKSRLEKHQNRLNALNCPDNETQQIRGRIDELNELLGLPDKTEAAIFLKESRQEEGHAGSMY